MASADPTSPEATASGTSTTRPLVVRKRTDIVVVRQNTGGDDFYVLKNPVDLQYHRLLAEEFFVWHELDGRTSLEQLKRDFERRFPPQRMEAGELQRLILNLHERNLIDSRVRGQGAQLIRRRRSRNRREWLQKLSNPLAFRLRGFDPDRLLAALHGFTFFVFHPAWVFAWGLFLVASLGLGLLHAEELASRLPRIHEFLTPTNIVWLAVATAGVKVFHELGHGLACKHFGGEVRELGLMFLMFAPCLYCNASDSWLFRSKWRRAAVAAAGVYFETMLAGVALWIWWLANPGALRDVALDVAFVCSLSTLIFNGNPLLRFDGYYVFSDLLGIPNLAEKCSLFWRRVLGSLCLGIVYPADFQLPENRRMLLGVYGAASFCYRWFVTISILYFLYTYFKQHELTPLFYVVASLSILPKAAKLAWSAGKSVSNPGLLPKVKQGRCLISAAALIVLLGALLFVPIPHRVFCPAEIVPADDSAVYAEMPGALAAVYRRLGDRVAAGDIIADLENVDARMEERRLEAQCDEYEATLAALQRNQFQDRGAALEIAVTRQALDASKKLLTERRADVRRLRVTAPSAGYILPPPESHREKPRVDNGLPFWSGDVFEARNVGCRVEEGTMLCRIGDPRSLEAELVIEHADYELVAVGQRVEIMLTAVPGRSLTGVISELGESDLQSTPKRLSHTGGGEVSSKTDAAGVERPRHASYFARVALDPADFNLLRLGVRGRAKIGVGSATAYEIIDRYLRNLFTFRL